MSQAFPYFIMDIDPVAFRVFSWPIHWYALAYMPGIICAYLFGVKHAASWLGMDKKMWHQCIDTIFLYGLIGGRLGQGVFYDAAYWIKHPLEIFFIWHGGMSFFGAILGGLTGIYMFQKKYRIPSLRLTDTIVTYVPIGLGLGRIANMINSECLGRVNTAWGVIFPRIDSLPRYPTQLFEAIMEGIFLGVLLSCTPYKREGLRSGIFIIAYSLIRLIIEPFKEQETTWFIFHYACNPSSILAALLLILGVVCLHLRPQATLGE